MPDRFDNGDPGNDRGDENTPASYGGYDPTHKGFFHGGDFAGLSRRLDYLQDLGVTALWMTPILRNKAIQAFPRPTTATGYSTSRRSTPIGVATRNCWRSSRLRTHAT